MVEKLVTVEFKVLSNGSIIHSISKNTAVTFDKNGTFSLTPYRPTKKETLGKITIEVPETIYKNVYALSFHRGTKEKIMHVIKEAIQIATKHNAKNRRK